jgi:hypothetical protein
MNPAGRRPVPSKRALPVLERITIANPCDEDWDAMVGDDRVRMCARCDKQLHDLSRLTRAEATRLVAEPAQAGDDDAQESVCVRLVRRSDGTVVTSDTPPSAPTAGPAWWLARSASASLRRLGSSGSSEP